MTPSEYQALSNPQLTHPARSLYTLHLRRIASTTYPVLICYKTLIPALLTYDYTLTAKQLTQLLEALQVCGLIQLAEPQVSEGHYHQAAFYLPLSEFASMNDKPLPIPHQAFAMHLNWCPSQQFSTLCRLCGHASSEFSSQDLGEFIAYWLGRPDVMHNQHHWMLKFIKHLKNKQIHGVALCTHPSQRYNDQMSSSSRSVTENKASPRALEMMEQAQRYLATSKKHGKE